MDEVDDVYDGERREQEMNTRIDVIAGRSIVEEAEAFDAPSHRRFRRRRIVKDLLLGTQVPPQTLQGVSDVPPALHRARRCECLRHLLSAPTRRESAQRARGGPIMCQRVREPFI